MAAAEAPVSRLCYGALHVVMQPSYQRLGHRPDQPGDPTTIEAHVDWDTTMRLRCQLDRCGMGVAEAMDTAQRFAIGWPAARRLIASTGALQLDHGFCAGASADQIASVKTATDLIDAVVEQCGFIASHGGIPVLLPMPWLCQQQASEQSFVDVYRAIIEQVHGPVFLHWLGPMFLPSLAGYFPGNSFARIMAIDPSVVRGCKLSLLDAEFEQRVRRDLLASEQIVLTGDDFHFGQLLLGDGMPPTRSTTVGDRTVALGDFSHALLGIFDAIAKPMQTALRHLEAGELAAFRQLVADCEALGQHVFGEPTRFYKSGLAFLAWLNGLQDNFALVNGEEHMRSHEHYLACAELARRADCVLDEQTFTQRLREFRERA